METKNHMLQELTTLEREFAELENAAFEELHLDSITKERVEKRKEWVKLRLDLLRAELYPEVVA